MNILVEKCCENVNICVEEIVKVIKGIKFVSKVVIYLGDIKYFKNKFGYYKEYIIVGKLLIELFWLELVSNEGCINFYVDFLIY